jgi:hypothetical protein
MPRFTRPSPLLALELEAEKKAQEYKRKLIQEGLAKLAAEKAGEIFPPQGNPLPPHSDAPPSAPDKRGQG